MNATSRGNSGSAADGMRSRANVGRRSVLYPEQQPPPPPFGGSSSNHSGYIYEEDYGDDDDDRASVSKKRNRQLLSGPMICLWSCRRTMFSPAVVSAVAMMSSLISIQFVDSLLVTVASALTLATGLLVLLQQRKLRCMGNLRREHNELRRKANYFHQERERLHRAQERLDQTLAELHYIPQELHKLSKNKDVHQLTSIVEEQKVVQEAIRKKIQQRVMQQMLGVVVQADRDQDFALGAQEIELLVVRLGVVKGIEFNQKRFREMMAEDPTIHSVFKMLRSMQEGDDEYQYAQPVFVIKPPQSAEESVEDNEEEMGHPSPGVGASF
jgi:hypothetical protein